MRPSLTVVIPTHDRATLLSEAIQSVLRSALVVPEQVVVVDDGSSDATAEVVRRFGEPELAVLRERPEAGFAYGRVQMTTMSLDPIGEPFPLPPLLSGYVPEQIYRRPPQLGAVVFRTEALREVGGI